MLRFLGNCIKAYIWVWIICIAFMFLGAACAPSSAQSRELSAQEKAYFHLINLYQRADIRAFCHENPDGAYPEMYGDKALRIDCKTRREWFAMWGRKDDGSNGPSIASR